MFEHRLKVFLVVLLLVTLTLVLRAAQVQVLQHKAWQEQAAKALTRSEHIETRRGAILDRNDIVMAMDEPCVDACVDYRALAPTPDPQWVKNVARGRLRDRLLTAYDEAPLERRQVMLDAEVEAVLKDIRQTIPKLAAITGHDERRLEDLRTAIVEKVRMRQRFLWYRTYELARNRHLTVSQAQTQPSSLWQKWLLDDTGDAPELDAFYLRVSEETAKHVLVRNVTLEMQTEIGKQIDRFPGLELRAGNRRFYRLGAVAGHLLGRMSRVTREDIEKDPYFGVDELRQYQQTDLKGRGGLEELCEPVLRGTRGEIAKVDGREVSVRPRELGQDVRASIDVVLQEQIEGLFERVPIVTKVAGRQDVTEHVAMLGAAVVIDVPTGEILSLVSAPGFDPNRYEEDFRQLSDRENLKSPLLNRATQVMREPGSTVKPVVGIAGVAAGVRRADEGYECIGYMKLNGRALGHSRCWVASMFHNEVCSPDCKLLPCPTVAHHRIGQLPHPDGFLKLADAIERSCNPYFQSIADVLGPVRLSDWYRKFGLGTRTYVGIAEAAGRLPDRDLATLRGPAATFSTWTAGIGQGPVNATPLQMANVAATVARGGVWVRPKLVRTSGAGGQHQLPPTTQAADRIDLNLPPEALAAVREGMFRVVHTRAGSGDAARRADIAVAGKTGTAQAAWIKVPMRDPKTGAVLTDEKGKPRLKFLELSTLENPNPDAPWYRGTGRTGGLPHHSWFIGYAPAEKPQIAFAVLVEYGGAGGGPAGSLASKIVELCIARGILQPPEKPAQVAASTAPATPLAASPLSPAPDVELLHDVPATAAAARATGTAPGAVTRPVTPPASQPAPRQARTAAPR